MSSRDAELPEADASPHSDERSELLRVGSIVFDCAAGAHYLQVAVVRSWELYQHELTLPGGDRSAVPLYFGAVCICIASVAFVMAWLQWRRHRFRWVLQLSIGLVPVLGLVSAYVYPILFHSGFFKELSP